MAASQDPKTPVQCTELPDVIARDKRRFDSLALLTRFQGQFLNNPCSIHSDEAKDALKKFAENPFVRSYDEIKDSVTALRPWWPVDHLTIGTRILSAFFGTGNLDELKNREAFNLVFSHFYHRERRDLKQLSESKDKNRDVAKCAIARTWAYCFSCSFRSRSQQLLLYEDAIMPLLDLIDKARRFARETTTLSTEAVTPNLSHISGLVSIVLGYIGNEKEIIANDFFFSSNGKYYDSLSSVIDAFAHIEDPPTWSSLDYVTYTLREEGVPFWIGGSTKREQDKKLNISK